MEYDILVGFCAGRVDECVRGLRHKDVKQGSIDELSFSEITNYFYFLEFERDVFKLMLDVTDVLYEFDTMYSFDEEKGLIVYDFDKQGGIRFEQLL